MSNVYVIDSSSLIDLHRHYPRRIFRSVWGKFESLTTEDRIMSSRAVFDEIARREDELHEWCNDIKNIFRKIDLDTAMRAKKITSKFPKLLRQPEPSMEADPYVIALASLLATDSLSDKPMIITQEKNKPNKIPAVAKEYGIECTTILELFEREGWIF